MDEAETNIDERGLRQLDNNGLEAILGFALSRARQAIFRDFQRRFGNLDLTPNLYSILLLVEANPGCRQMDIGATLGILQTNLVKRIGALLDRGLLQRTIDRTDRRARVLSLTVTGEAFVARIRAIHADLTENLVAALGGQQPHDRLLELLERVAAYDSGEPISDD